jgi:hypothetical protein
VAPNDRYRGDHLPVIGADILNLPSLQLQKIALTRIAQLASGEISGKPLTRDLRGCFKLYFDEQENDVGRRLNRPAPGYRIVYRILPPIDDPPDRDARPRLQVLAVGPRARQEAYERAAARMARPEVPREIEPPSPRLTRPAQRPRRPSSEAEQFREAPRPRQRRSL